MNWLVRQRRQRLTVVAKTDEKSIKQQTAQRMRGTTFGRRKVEREVELPKSMPFDVDNSYLLGSWTRYVCVNVIAAS